MLDTVSTIALWAIPAILAITLHEAAHGYVAKLCGDRTAWVLGRVTMNPIRARRFVAGKLDQRGLKFVIRVGKARTGQLQTAAQSQDGHDLGCFGRSRL